VHVIVRGEPLLASPLVKSSTMSCEMFSESQNSNNSGPLTTPIGIRTTNLSCRSSSSNQLSSLLTTSGSKDYRLDSSHADYNADSDHARITMKTRVAVRDKTPHRFQVVPLRDVSKPATLEGGRPSQLGLPLASHTLLRSASIRRQAYSQVRPVVASSCSQMDLNIQDNCNIIMLADRETLATPCAEMLAMPVLALSASFELDNLGESHALAEQDLNRQCTTYTTHKFESSITTPTTAQSYDASHYAHVKNPVALISDRSPSVHTTSQSLDLALCNSGAYPKISKENTPEHLNPIIQSSIIDSKSPRKKRTRSENIPSIRDKSQRDGRNGPASTVSRESCDFRMTKRHAIYTQSLYVPFLESPSYFPGSSTKNRQGRHQLSGVHPNENVSDNHRIHHPERVSFGQMSQPFVSDSGATLPNTNSDDQSSPTTRRVLQDIEEAAQSLQVLKPRASTTVPHTRGLNYRRLSRVYPLSAEARLHGKIVYPQIVCEMFTDIDRAIHEWKHI